MWFPHYITQIKKRKKKKIYKNTDEKKDKSRYIKFSTQNKSSSEMLNDVNHIKFFKYVNGL